MKPSDLLPDRIAKEFGFSRSQLERMLQDPEIFYRPRRTELVKGKVRQIDPIKWKFRANFRRLHKFLQAEFPAHFIAYGCVRRRSCNDAATVHLNSGFVVTRDVQDCYPSIGSEQLKASLQNLGFRSDTAWFLSQLMTRLDSIPQGSPLSGDALNLYFFVADERVANRCSGWARATRTADDIVISSDDISRKDEAAQIIEEEVAGIGLVINEKKKIKSGFQPSSQVQLVHNIVVNSPHGTGISAGHRDQAIEIGSNYVRATQFLSHDSLEATRDLRLKLQGWINYCRQLKFSPVKHLQRLLAQGDRRVSRILKSEGVYLGRYWWLKTKRINRAQELAICWARKAVGQGPSTATARTRGVAG